MWLEPPYKMPLTCSPTCVFADWYQCAVAKKGDRRADCCLFNRQLARVGIDLTLPVGKMVFSASDARKVCKFLSFSLLSCPLLSLNCVNYESSPYRIDRCYYQML